MHSPYGLEVSDSCVECKIRSAGYFCDFNADLVKEFESLKYATVFPKGAVLFVEGQSPRGVFMICSGRGEKVGLAKVRLYRPFSASHLLAALPEKCKKIAVLDRTKEPGAAGEPLYQDVVAAIAESSMSGDTRFNRYGNGSPTVTKTRSPLPKPEASNG